MTIRRMSPAEVELHRTLRLEALRDSPDSFGERYESASLLDAATWEQRTRRAASGEAGVTIVAEVDGMACGSAYGLFDTERTGAGRVGGMWVSPLHRGRGIATALLSAVLDWASEESLGDVRLWAPAHEEAALRLYRRAGFLPTGASRPLPVNPSRVIVEMLRAGSGG